MKKLYRTLSIDEYLGKSENEIKPETNFTSSLRFTKTFSSLSFSHLVKLKNDNFHKSLKLKKLKAEIENLSEPSPIPDLSTNPSKSSIKSCIKDCESKTLIENSNSIQLKKMILYKQEHIVRPTQNELKAKNSSLQDYLSKISSQYEKLLKFTSNANTLKITAQNSLQVFTRNSFKANAENKKNMIKKKNEMIGLENLIRSKAQELNNKEIEEEQISSRRHALINQLNLHLKESKKIKKQGLLVKEKLEKFKSAFDFVFKKIGFEGKISQQAVQFIIDKINKNLFCNGSASERYVHLSQLHQVKVEELEKVVAELNLLMGNMELSKVDKGRGDTFNIIRYQTENLYLKVDNKLESELLNVYGQSLTLFHKFLQQLKKIEENSNLSIRSMSLLKDLESSLTYFKREGRKTLFKAVSHQGFLDQARSSLLPSSRPTLEQEIQRYFPKNPEKTSIILSLLKLSPITKFMLTFDVFEKFLISGSIEQDFPELLSSCFRKLQRQYENIMEILMELLGSVKNFNESEGVFKHQTSITDIRRNCLHVKTSLTMVPTKANTSRSQKIRKKSGMVRCELNSIESIQEKIEKLKKCHMKATKSNEFIKNELPDIKYFKSRGK